MKRANDQNLAIFVKAPQMGRVKTRLAKDIGTFEAWRLYHKMTAHVIATVTENPLWRTTLWVTPDHLGCHGRFWPALTKAGQGYGDLGARLGKAARSAGPSPILFIGSDIPDIRREHIVEAFHLLERHDVVMGPAPDGGYWLIGLRHGAGLASIFRNIRWSSEHTAADTLARIPHTRSVAFMEQLQDVDYLADLKRIRRLF